MHNILLKMEKKMQSKFGKILEKIQSPPLILYQRQEITSNYFPLLLIFFIFFVIYFFEYKYLYN